MPNCFQLISKSTGKATRFTDIDRELCDHLKQPCDDHWYLYGWYNWIGFSLVCGKSFTEIANILADDPELLKINTYLAEHYTAEAWVEIGRSA